MGGADRGLAREVEEACSPLLERCTFPEPGAEVDLAVSGGPDSTALLVLAVAAGCRATAIHVDHSTRSGSASEAEIVAEAAARLDAGFRSLTIRVEPGPNLEARLRTERWSVLPAGTATGHTADDRAETILLNLMRGCGLDGLVAMEGAFHPIIRLRRAETRALCAQLGFPTVSDPTNQDPAYRRNRVRAELLPLMDDVARRDVAGVLSRQAELLRDDAAFLDELACALDPTDAAALTAAPRPLARRALRRWLSGELEGGYVPAAAAVDRVLEVAACRALGCDVAQGVSVRRSAGRLRIVKSGARPESPSRGDGELGLLSCGTEAGDLPSSAASASDERSDGGAPWA